jgi:hypothetical protein
MLVYLKLFERIYAPLTAGLLHPINPDSQLQQRKRTQLDRLYQRNRRQPRSTPQRRRPKACRLTTNEQNSRYRTHNGLSIALTDLGEREPVTPRLKEAMTANNEALERSAVH